MKRVVILRKLQLPGRLVSSALASRAGQSSHRCAVTLVPGAWLYPGEHRMLPDDVLSNLQLAVDYRHPWPGELPPMIQTPVFDQPANRKPNIWGRIPKKVKHAGK